jgi:RNA polymerase sigma-70 factor, ECF subfamily
VVDDRRPGCIELLCGSGGAPPGDAVGLLDERDADSFGNSCASCRDQVRCADSSAGSVTEDDRCLRLVGALQVRSRGTVRRLHLDRHGLPFSLVPAQATTPRVPPRELEQQLEQYRSELTAYCYRMLGSIDAEDAVQETFLRAWRSYDSFEGRAALRSWLYRIATNVCLDMLEGRKRRARPMDLGPAREPEAAHLNTLPEVTWIEPMPDGRIVPEGDPADVAVARETIRLAFIAALQHLPPRQRAVLILREVLRWKASEVAELLETSVASVNSALQRARSNLEASNVTAIGTSAVAEGADAELLSRYVDAFERYDMAELTSLIHEDATQSMPPYDLWLAGRDNIFSWWVGPGVACRGSRMVPTVAANGAPAFGQYKPTETGDGYEPWALQVLEIEDRKIVELTFFLDTKTVFPLFGLPLEYEERGQD